MDKQDTEKRGKEAMRKLHATRLGLMVLLPVYTLITAWAVALVIFIAPLDSIRRLELLVELRSGELRGMLGFLFPVELGGFVISLASIITMPVAVVLWLGLLYSLRAVSRDGSGDSLRMHKMLKWMMAFAPFNLLLSAFTGFVVADWIGEPLGSTYRAAALTLLILFFYLLHKMFRQMEPNVMRSAYPGNPPVPLLRTIIMLFGVFVVSALVIIVWPSRFFGLEYIYAPLLILIMALSVGLWRAPLSLWRRRSGWVILAASSFMAAAIGMVALVAYTFMDFNAGERLQSILAGDDPGVILSPFVLVPLTLLPFLLPLIPLLLWLSTTHARLRRERDAAREG